MLSLVIRGGTVVTPAGTGVWDIGVDDEKVAAIGLPGTLGEAQRTIDASGMIVVPGGVEAHTHLGFPHLPHPFPTFVGSEQMSRAALLGGTTTYFDFVEGATSPTSDLLKNVQGHLEHFKGKSYADYSVHVNFRRPGTSAHTLGQIRELIAAGFPSLKTFTTNFAPKPNRPDLMMTAGKMHEIMTQTAKHGGIVAIHSEDDEIIQHNYDIYAAAGKLEWWHIPEIRSNLSELLSVRRNLDIAAATGSAVYFVHTSAHEAVDAIVESRAKDQPAYCESILLYASFTSDDYRRPSGIQYHTFPGTKSETDRERLWHGLVNGDISILATDAIGTTLAEKTKGRTAVDALGGNVGIGLRMGITYGDGVVRRGMSLERYAHVTSTGPAKLLGLYPRKGAIAPGSDADITVIDPTIKRKITIEDAHLTDYNPWEGWDVNGWPTTVVLRGRVVVRDGKLLGKPTDGRHVDGRKIKSDVLTSPAV